ncbi:uncharacterized protein ycf45 [Cucumis sativus]|uniref:AAA+ ATPase domain-containing protein n=1 Tax=Cucumis sativus TaxID=3659 RepID=A0A0A0L035_CUCSA|nr:uncharacterized protein ycf45 [Cucumis sativus]KGN55083.1 hypothetical protein Csa_012092 [Cucumis sativus]
MLSFTHFNHLLLLPLPPTTQFKFQAPFPKFQLQSHFSLQLFPQPPSISHFLANRPSGCRQLCLYSSNSLGFSPSDEDFDDELDRLLVLLPEEMRRRIREHEECHQLIEVVLDLGRKPLARFPTGDFLLSDSLVTVDDLRHATSKVGDFAIDNRAGISRTLHRISAIRNRKGVIIGLTCRVGRAISGSAILLRDLIQDGASLLLIGPPGVGKTTIIREIARILANDFKKRVMIVDTSNEIGGDGDIPHAGIGNARRMQVPDSDMQHKVLIEAVENHMPQVIIIDEISTKLEAMAASTIAQRGIQLVATAHGVTIENLIMNPLLEMLVGGIQSVTLGDEEASRRRVQKTVLERKGPSTFACGVEIISKTELRVHRSLDATVDAVLCGRYPNVEVRKINSTEEKETMQSDISISTIAQNKDDAPVSVSDTYYEQSGQAPSEMSFEVLPTAGESSEEDEGKFPLYLFVYGVLEASVIQGFKQLRMNDVAIHFTDNISEADALFALQPKLKKNAGIQAAAKSHDIPIYVVKTGSLVHITRALRALIIDQEDEGEDFESLGRMRSSEKIDALEEARMAIEQIVIPREESVELLPRPPHILSLQMDLIRKYHLQSERIGMETNVRLRILPLIANNVDENAKTQGKVDPTTEFDDFIGSNGDTNGTLYSVDRLPLLPE